MSRRTVDKYAALLRHCNFSKDLSSGYLLHDCIIKENIFPSSILLFNLLIQFYGSCGALRDARSVFDHMPRCNIFSWNLIMAAYLANGHPSDSFSLFQSLYSESPCTPDCTTFATVLSACAFRSWFSKGLWLHRLIILFAFECQVVVATALVTMYGKCSKIDHANWTFANMHERNSCSWNAMLAAIAKYGDIRAFHHVFSQMIQEGMLGDRITCISAISMYASHDWLLEGKRLHASLTGRPYEADAALQNALISFYGKYDNKEDAVGLFHASQERNLITWNAIIATLVQAHKFTEAMDTFMRMQLEGMAPDEVTFSTIFSLFSGAVVAPKIKFLHACVAESVLASDIIVQTALISMYGNHGRIEEARMVFDTTETRDVAGWNAMISAYSQHGNTEASISLFFDMLMHAQDPDKISLIAVLSVCADQVAIVFGTLIHHYIVSCSAKLELEIGNSLLNMYGRGGSLEDALEVFCAMSDHNLVSWSSLIILYAQHDLMEEALKLFEQMLAAGVTPDKVIFLCAIPLCASEAALELGRKMHHSAVCCGFHTDDVCATAFLTMYSKCGSFEESKRMFHVLEVRNLVSWNSLIAAHAHHGHGTKAILCLSYMSYHGLAPDECTFYSILSACSHAGLLEEGLWYFANMVQQSLIVPRVEHFNCIIDLFGRAGQLEAVDLVLNRMGLQPSDTSWVTMLSACRVHLDVIRGENAVAELSDASWMDLTPTLLLSNIYHAKRFDDY